MHRNLRVTHANRSYLDISPRAETMDVGMDGQLIFLCAKHTHSEHLLFLKYYVNVHICWV